MRFEIQCASRKNKRYDIDIDNNSWIKVSDGDTREQTIEQFMIGLNDGKVNIKDNWVRLIDRKYNTVSNY